ncbi:hypothetical protein MGSAQ_000235 [marine sediment metagenome]|uniref:Uncharacterized protein n=1 Tax=marine sediment metagenome TaxID=412755 RepID=A0A1B6NXY1_9ZZZZ
MLLRSRLNLAGLLITTQLIPIAQQTLTLMILNLRIPPMFICLRQAMIVTMD